MPRASPILSAFNSGELSPHLAGRVDIAKYGNGCKVLENFIPLIQGPGKRRGGTRRVAEVKDSNARTWLVRFEFNTTNAYQIEFGDHYLRFYTNHGQVQVSGVAAYNGATTYAIGDLVLQGGINYYCILATTGNAPPNATYWYPLTGTIYEIPTPWSASDLTNSDGTFNMRFTESNDIIYLFHGSYQPRKLLRFGATNWRIDTYVPTSGPFKDVNLTATTVYAGASTGATTLTASTAIFSASHVGALFYLEQASVLGIAQWEAGKVIAIGDRRRSGNINYRALTAGTTGTDKPAHTLGAQYDGSAGVQWQYEDPGYGYGIITGFTSTTVVNVTIMNQIPFYATGAGNPSTRWAFGAWSDVEGWPTQVNFYKERMAIGRGQQIWLSVSADYQNFSSKDASGVVVADQAISLTLQSDKVNELTWLSSSDALICGTTGGEFAVQSITTNLPFGPDNCTAPSISAFGTKNMTPVKIADVVAFIQRSGIKMRDLSYDAYSSKFQSTDQNIMADHITQGGVNQIVFQQEPYSIIWAVRTDGSLIAMTYSREQFESPPFGGWHRQPIGGLFNSGPAFVDCVSLIPAPAGDRDELWLIVKRTINGVTKRYIEYMENERRPNDDPQDSFYVDCGASFVNSVNATLTPAAGALVKGTTGVVFTTGSAIFSAGDVGREIHYRYFTWNDDGRTKDWFMSKALITAYTDTTHVVCTINTAFPSTALIAAGNWRMTVSTISGLGYLEGQTVQLLGDGATLPEQVVSGGSITLPTQSSKVQIGLKARARLQTMRLNAGAGDGTSQGKTARINKLVLRFDESMGCKFGPSFNELVEIDFRSVSDNMDGPPALFTGDQLMDFDSDYTNDPWVCVQQDLPLPCTLVAVLPTTSVYDRG